MTAGKSLAERLREAAVEHYSALRDGTAALLTEAADALENSSQACPRCKYPDGRFCGCEL